MANVVVFLGQLGAAVNGRLVDLGGDVYALQVALTPVTKAGAAVAQATAAREFVFVTRRV